MPNYPTGHFPSTRLLVSLDYWGPYEFRSFCGVHKKTVYTKEIENDVSVEIIRTVTVGQLMLRDLDLPKFLW